ncbi:MAG: adenylate/guanylate cyclase domain-containing protein [Anaerolineales bacterium]
MVRLGTGASLLGAFLTFFYFNVIDLLPIQGETARPLEFADILVFAAVFAALGIAFRFVRRRAWRTIDGWYWRMLEGTTKQELPAEVARMVLNVPLNAAMRIAAAWLIAGVVISLWAGRPLLGAAVGGIVNIAIVFFSYDLLWRREILVFFPGGEISSIRGARFPLYARMLVFFLLVGVLPSLLMFIIVLQRLPALSTAGDRQAVIENMVIAQLFILLVGLLASIALASFLSRAILEPLRALEDAMRRVKELDFEASVPVSTNDELGYLGEGFNQMTAGLRQGERMRELFGLYVSPEVARAAVESGAELGGEMVQCTVMFSDLRDFTALTERLTPNDLVDVINRYMNAMVEEIVRQGGVVTRFGGDSILAVFGSPLNRMADHASRAARAALGMRQALAAFNQLRDGLHLESGIGIASGRVVAGNVGAKERIEYTVMGDAANLAARLQDITKELGRPILLSEETFRALDGTGDFEMDRIPKVAIRGRQDPVTIYALSDLSR